jgi:hypothetical protein
MALKARQEGHFDYAEHFTLRASEILAQPTALERLGTQSGEKFTEHPRLEGRPCEAIVKIAAGQARAGPAWCSKKEAPLEGAGEA